MMACTQHCQIVEEEASHVLQAPMGCNVTEGRSICGVSWKQYFRHGALRKALICHRLAPRCRTAERQVLGRPSFLPARTQKCKVTQATAAFY